MNRFPSLCLALLCAATLSSPAADIPAFPGAEGFGAVAKGGRGGRVIEVTNLNDGGEGSLRAACEAEGPRTVVFRTGGIIELKKAIRFKSPFITIAGQTAPGAGICLKNHGLFVEDTHDVIIRHLRLRPGAESGKAIDGLTLLGSERIIVDHCSISWSVDECIGLTGNAKTGHVKTRNCTIQWCIVSEPLRHSVHDKDAHGYSFLMNFAEEASVSVHHNLFAHMITRAPRPGAADNGVMLFDFRNNILYDWTAQAGYSGTGTVHMNYINNWIRPGPCTIGTSGKKAFAPERDTRMCLAGNVYQGNDEYTKDIRLVIKMPDLEAAAKAAGTAPANPPEPSQTQPTPKLTKEEKAKLVAEQARLAREEHLRRVQEHLVEKPYEVAAVTTQSARDALDSVLDQAGATQPMRDCIDRRVITETREGSGRLIDDPIEVGGWPAYAAGEAPADADHDGMPDEWEKKFGLDPAKDDHAGDADGDGYENLEEFLNVTDPTR